VSERASVCAQHSPGPGAQLARCRKLAKGARQRIDIDRRTDGDDDDRCPRMPAPANQALRCDRPDRTYSSSGSGHWARLQLQRRKAWPR